MSRRKYTETDKIMDKEMEDILQTMQVTAPNTMNTLSFDTYYGCYVIQDSYGKVLKKYHRFCNAIDWLMLND